MAASGTSDASWSPGSAPELNTCDDGRVPLGCGGGVRVSTLSAPTNSRIASNILWLTPWWLSSTRRWYAHQVASRRKAAAELRIGISWPFASRTVDGGGGHERAPGWEMRENARSIVSASNCRMYGSHPAPESWTMRPTLSGCNMRCSTLYRACTSVNGVTLRSAPPLPAGSANISSRMQHRYDHSPRHPAGRPGRLTSAVA
mmetsp:Transcript_29352/g.76946  ORF Transcript_29352/g.76946 Transcript_29352/m.76946 type:complete len:202 (+) Transcript_29352:126-731(+)